MRSKRWLGVGGVLGLAMVLLPSSAAAAGDSATYGEGEAVTVVLPLTAGEEQKETRDGGKVYEFEVSLDGQGGLVLGGDPAWRSHSLPVVANGQVTTIKTSKRAKETTLSVSGDGTTFTFRIPKDAAWHGPVTEVLVPGHSTASAPSEALTESLNRMIEAFCDTQFTAPLDGLDPRIRRRVAELKFAVGATGPPAVSSLDGEVYFVAELGEGTVVYNSLTTTQSQRVSNTITDRVLPGVKAWAQVFFGEVPFFGLRLTATITHKDFTKYPPAPAFDELALYVSLDDAEAYAADELSAQDLVDASKVTLNGSPFRVNLANGSVR